MCDAENPILAAAHQAALAQVELLRFAAEGPSSFSLFEAEVAELLASSLMKVIEIESGDFEDETARQLFGALTRFLEGWQG